MPDFTIAMVRMETYKQKVIPFKKNSDDLQKIVLDLKNPESQINECDELSQKSDDTNKTDPHSLCFNFEVYSKNNIGSILCE